MLRRSVLERLPRNSGARRFHLSSWRKASTSGANSLGEPDASEGNSLKVVLGGAAVVGAFLVAYQTGYLDQYLGKDMQKLSEPVTDTVTKILEAAHHGVENPARVSSSLDGQPGVPHSKASATVTKKIEEAHHSVENPAGVSSSMDGQPGVPHSKASVGMKGDTKVQSQADPTPERVESSPKSPDNNSISQDPGTKSDQSQEIISARLEAVPRAVVSAQSSSVNRESEMGSASPKDPATDKAPEALLNSTEVLKDEDGKLLFDVWVAVRAAEKRQALLDAQVCAEEFLAYKSAMEEKFQQQETESQLALTKAEEMAKANLNLAIAKDKAAQIQNMAKADLNGATVLYARLSKGLPIQKEIDMLQPYILKGSILDLVLTSLPQEARSNGTDTVLQLKQKFNTLKGTVRHFSLIPSGGGGILAHSLAYMAYRLKFKEVDQSNGGIESVIKKVDNYLAEGKLAEAAAALEEGVKGTKADEIVSDWVRHARDRAITEQALIILESYATCASLSH